MANEQTIGSMDLSCEIGVGREVTIQGYVVPTVTEAFTGDCIFISILEGEDGLFVPGSGTIATLSEDWEPENFGKVLKSREDGYASFVLRYTGIDETSDPVNFTITGTVPQTVGATKVVLREQSGATGETKQPAEQYLIKKKMPVEGLQFYAARKCDLQNASWEFEQWETISFFWNDCGGYYRLFKEDSGCVLYEGTGTSFEYLPGIWDTSVFVLQALSGEKAVAQAQLVLKASNCHKIIKTVGVQDGSGLNFFFDLYDTNEIYCHCYPAEEELFTLHKLACQGQCRDQWSGLWADRLPDGRVIVFSAVNHVLCCQIQTAVGKTGFGVLNRRELIPDMGRSFFWYPFGILRMSTCLTSSGLHVAVMTAETYSGVSIFYGVWKDGTGELKKIEALEALQSSYNVNMELAMHVQEEKVQLYISGLYDEAREKSLDLCVVDGQSGEYTLYKPAETVSETVSGLENGDSWGVSCVSGKTLGRMVPDKSTSTYSLTPLVSQVTSYILSESGLGWCYVCSDPADVITKIGFADEAGSVTTEEVVVGGGPGVMAKHAVAHPFCSVGMVSDTYWLRGYLEITDREGGRKSYGTVIDLTVSGTDKGRENLLNRLGRYSLPLHCRMQPEQAIPFRVGNPVLNSETVKAIEDARNGIGLSRGFASVSELMEDLDADD